MLQSRVVVVLAIVVGLLLIAVAVVYWAEPAHAVPGFFPGHDATSNHHHLKRGIVAFIVGLALLIFAWFQTGRSRRSASSAS